MKALLIHLSDMHIQVTGNEVLLRTANIKNALRDLIFEADFVCVIISGDIANSGKNEEYAVARTFLDDLEHQVQQIKESIKFYYVIVPGNHDCNFETHDSTRNFIIDSISQRDAEELDIEIINSCLKPQSDFFTWSSLLQEPNIFENSSKRLYFERICRSGVGLKIKFRCINTAWMSRPGKNHENIIFPLQLLPARGEDDESSVVISVVHHPSNWIVSETATKFRKKIEHISNLIITGHEHEAAYREQRYLKGETVHYFEGGSLQGQEGSSFNAAMINADTRKIRYFKFEWNGEMYKSEDSDWVDIPRNSTLRQDIFNQTPAFVDFLADPGVPFSHPRKKDLAIQDIYIFPDLDEISGEMDDNLIYSEKVEEYLCTNHKVFALGADSAGKTSLLKRMFEVYRKKGLVPLWVDGQNITSIDPEKLRSKLTECYCSEYGDHYIDDYWTLDPSHKALLLDDLHEVNLNRKSKSELFNFISRNFEYVLISTEDHIGLNQIAEAEENDLIVSSKFVELAEFGSLMKGKLIEKWLLLGREQEIDETQLEAEVKRIEESTRIILSPSLIPSYPFYILTIAQAAEGMVNQMPLPFTKDTGSFGFFYDWLITTSLHGSPKKIADINAKYRYLAEISYLLFESGKVSIEENALLDFHEFYLKKYSLRPSDLPYGDMTHDLVCAKMMKTVNGSYEFEYPCIFYYFVARALNARLQNPGTESEVKDLISELIGNINTEQNEFILLFLSYLSENPYIRDSLLTAARQMFKDNKPADLDSDLDFVNRSGDTEKYTMPLTLPPENPKEVRQTAQKHEDTKARARRKGHAQEPAVDIDKDIKSIRDALKTMRIMGQLVKNFATSLEGTEKYKLAEESYLLGLRVLENILTYFERTIDGFVQETKNMIKYRHDKQMMNLPAERRHILTDSEAEMAAHATAFIITFLVSYNGILAIARSVGHEKLYPIHKEVLEKFSQLVSVRLIDITIKIDCQLHLPLDQMESVLKELKNNYIARLILRRLAFTRMSLYQTERTEKQRCCQMLEIKQDNPRLLMGRRRIDIT